MCILQRGTSMKFSRSIPMHHTQKMLLNLDLSAHLCIVKSVTWHEVWWRKVQGLLLGTRKGELVSFCLKEPNLMAIREGKGFNRQCEEKGHRVHDQLMHVFLIGWWWNSRLMFWESQSSISWFQPVWDQPECWWSSCSQHLPLVGEGSYFTSAKQLRKCASNPII